MINNPEHRDRNYGSRIAKELKTPRRSFASFASLVGKACLILLAVLSFALIAFILAAFMVPKSGRAHEAMSGWAYDASCCGGQDCWQLPEGAVSETLAGFTIKASGEFVTRAKAKPSGDEFFHLCRFPGPAIRCLYFPNRGF
jgi:hypothetical protein